MNSIGRERRKQGRKKGENSIIGESKVVMVGREWERKERLLEREGRKEKVKINRSGREGRKESREKVKNNVIGEGVSVMEMGKEWKRKGRFMEREERKEKVKMNRYGKKEGKR